MVSTIYNVDKISSLDATLYEDDSYGFLASIQSDPIVNWYIYDSDQLGVPVVSSLANSFMAFHGKISFPLHLQNNQNYNQYTKDGYWSAVPLGVFRYKMLSDGSPYLVDTVKHVPGYIVEGVYWLNGFVYLVRDDNKIIQLKLFVDHSTKDIQLYPDIQSL